MIDRAIGILGIALALATPFIGDFLPALPKWIPACTFVIAAFLIGVSLGLVSAGGLRSKRVVSKVASLRLHVFGDHRTPQRIASDNIFRWFYLQAAFVAVHPQGKQTIATTATLFVAFENDVEITTMHVRSPDMKLPIYEVKEFNQRFAVVQFTDNVPAGTLEIEVSL